MKKRLKAIVTYKDIIIGAILVAIVFTMIAFTYARAVTESADKSTYTYLTEISSLAAKEVNAKIGGNLQTMHALGALLNHQNLKTAEIIEALKVENLDDEFDDLFFVKPNGEAYGANVDGLNLSDREYFKRAMGGKENITANEDGRITSKRIIVYAVPLLVDGKVQGVLCGTQQYEKYQKVIDNDMLKGEGFSNIIDNQGNLIIKSTNKNCCTSVDNIIEEVKFNAAKMKKGMKEDLLAGKNGVAEYRLDGDLRMVSYTPIGYNDWFVTATLPSAVAKKQSNEILELTLILSVSLAVCIVIFFVYTSFRQIKNRKLIEKLAYVDELTGGPNFNKFKLMAKEIIESDFCQKLSMARVDINDFKIINDMYGFPDGDITLRNMKIAIESTIGVGDIFARVQNDEFLILLKSKDRDELEMLSKKFREVFLKLHRDSNKNYVVGFTIGIYLIPCGEKDVVQIIEKTTMAHRKAKKRNEQMMVVYDEEIREDAIREKNIENDMRFALEKGEFVVYMQPKHDLITGEIVGGESLIRWVKAVDKVLSPAEFIPIFEKNGFIKDLDLFVLEQTCRFQKSCIEKGLSPVKISVNQSKLLVCDEDYVEKVHDMVTRYEIPPSLIELELTETIIHDNIDLLSGITMKLKKLGYSISIDDFGSGYSSLNMLKDIEADVLKIDREFLCMAEDNERGKTVLSNIITMAKSLNMSIVAEGVETEKQAKLLRKLKCDTAQGYLYAKPMNVAEFEKRLNKI